MSQSFTEMLAKSKQKQTETKEGKYHDQVADYVTGKTDKQPTTINLKPTSTPPKKISFNDLLHGSGVTKRAAERSVKKLDKITAKDSSIDQETKQDFTDLSNKIAIDLKTPDDIKWDQYQLAALDGLEHQKYGCLIGAAGTGKTTVTKELVNRLYKNIGEFDYNKTYKILDNEGKETSDKKPAICFCAFTGRAVQQMKRPLPREYHKLCNTIHKTLGFYPTKEERTDPKTGKWKEYTVFKPTFTADNKLPFKICIVDEGGMVPIDLWNKLIAALPKSCRIIIIGDINQLPPVQGRSVLGFAMINWPTYALEHIHRQAADNPIINNAHRILNGKLPLVDKKRFAMVTAPDGAIGTMQKAVGVVENLHKKGIFDPFRDALIVPQNKGTIGQEYLNENLVNYFNAEKTDDNGTIINQRYVIVAGYTHVVFAVGDKVMLLQNDNMRGLTNGMTGVVTRIVPNGVFRDAGNSHLHADNIKFDEDIDFNIDDFGTEMDNLTIEEKKEDEEDENQRAASHIMTVQFGEVDNKREVDFSTAGQYRQIRHAYAFTCHKSQGGEYPTVIIVAHSANLNMLTREWLYTAVTRAQERVIIISNNRGLLHAVKQQTIKGNTIKEKAERFLALQGKDDTTLPYLPVPEKFK